MSVPTIQQIVTSPIIYSEYYDKSKAPDYINGKIYAYDKEHYYDWLAALKIAVSDK